MTEIQNQTPRMSRELLGKIVDDVFGGAIEDASVIEEIYAAIKRHETPAPQKHVVGLRKLPVAFEVLDNASGAYLTTSEDAARESGWEYNGLYRRDSAETGFAKSPAPPATYVTSSQAVLDVIAERRRQIEVHDFDASHDDMATRGQLALAGVSYAYEATRTGHQRQGDVGNPPPTWPWDIDWWKPTDRRRDLVKAAALIIAEIERLDRAAAKEDLDHG